MKAQNEFGRNTKEFVDFMNSRENSWNLGELFYEAWKKGFEPSAVASYLHSEIQFASVEFSMKMSSMEGHYGDKLKEGESFSKLYTDYRVVRDKQLSEARNANQLKV